MSQCINLVLLVTCIILIHADPLNENREEKNGHYVVTRPPQEILEGVASVSNIGNGSPEKLSNFTSNKATQKPNRPRPTKKPGTYIQSIWDIYGQRD